MADRQGQWFGDSVLKTLETTSVAEVIQLLPTNTILESARDVVFERSIITFQTRRLLTTAVEGCGFIVWKGNVLSGTTTPVEALDPLSLSTFSWAHKSIMRFGKLEVPGIIQSFDSAGAFVNKATDQRLTAQEVDFDVKRSVGRANEGIFLAVTADVSSVLKCLVTWRTYYTYA